MTRTTLATHYLGRIKPLTLAVCLLIAIVSTEHVLAQQLDAPANLGKRQWTSKTGATVNAAVAKIAEDSVVFDLGGGVQKSFPIADLSPGDEALLRVAFFGQSDEIQLAKAKKLIEQVVSTPKLPRDLLQEFHRDAETSPYAGLFCSTCLAAGENKNKEATVMLGQVIERIETQREYDSGRHRMTLASAQNNLAVCMLKARKFDIATQLIIKCMESMPVDSHIIKHNARQLFQMVSASTSTAKVGKTNKRRLEKQIAQLSPEISRLKTGWYYSLNVDLPDQKLRLQPMQGLESPKRGFLPDKFATGICLTDNTIVASTQSLNLVRTDEVIAFSVLTVKDGRMASHAAELKRVDIQNGLIALETTDGKLSPIDLQENPNPATKDVAVFGFKLNRNAVNRSAIESALGVVAVGQPDAPSVVLQKPMGGLVVDRSAQFLGLAYKDVLGLASSDANKPAFSLLPTKKIKEFAFWLNDAAATSNRGGFQQIRNGCALVVMWRGSEGAAVGQYLFGSPSIEAQTMALRDPWCIGCGGMGVVDCPNCLNGMVSTKRTVQLGKNPLTNDPVMGSKIFKEPCGVCSRKGKVDCRHCRDGRL